MAAAKAAGVRFLGHRDDPERLYGAFDIYVLASHREGFPRSAMEAAASAVPIVATDIRGCREVVDHERTGLLVPARDPLALEAAIDRLVGDAPPADGWARRQRRRPDASSISGESSPERSKSTTGSKRRRRNDPFIPSGPCAAAVHFLTGRWPARSTPRHPHRIMNFRDYIQVLRRRLFVVVIALVLGLAGGWFSPSAKAGSDTMFRATHTLIYEPGDGQGFNLEQVALLATSGAVPSRVAGRLNIDRAKVRSAVSAVAERQGRHDRHLREELRRRTSGAAGRRHRRGAPRRARRKRARPPLTPRWPGSQPWSTPAASQPAECPRRRRSGCGPRGS